MTALLTSPVTNDIGAPVVGHNDAHEPDRIYHGPSHVYNGRALMICSGNGSCGINGVISNTASRTHTSARCNSSTNGVSDEAAYASNDC